MLWNLRKVHQAVGCIHQKLRRKVWPQDINIETISVTCNQPLQMWYKTATVSCTAVGQDLRWKAVQMACVYSARSETSVRKTEYGGDLNNWSRDPLEDLPGTWTECLSRAGPSEQLPPGPPWAFGLPQMVTEFQEGCPKRVSESDYSKGPDGGCLASSDLVSEVM